LPIKKPGKAASVVGVFHQQRRGRLKKLSTENDDSFFNLRYVLKISLVRQDLIKASRSALMVAASVVGIPCGKPGYEISFPFFKSFTAFAPVSENGTI